ncbi:MAG: hypothetical protein QM773_00225 [Hyphomonadaceae bacterium]
MPKAALPDPERLRAANINPSTGLATDYLNHYNEIAMLIAGLSDLPEAREEVLSWRPVGYAAHFHMTGFSQRDLAIAAYEAVPSEVRTRFLAARRKLELAIMDVQDLIETRPDAMSHLAESAPRIFDAIARLGGVINGEAGEGAAQLGTTQSSVDSLFS